VRIFAVSEESRKKESASQVSETVTSKPGQLRQRDTAVNVLIVDDDPELAPFVLEILARKGIRGIVARDEKTALEFLDREHCDLVFAGESVCKRDGRRLGDLKMSEPADLCPQQPGGFGLLSKIKANSPELPVIMIGENHFATSLKPKTDSGKSPTTGSQSDKPREPLQEPKPQELRQIVATAVEAIRAGCYDFLIKPLDPEKVESLLDTFLPNHSVSTIAWAHEDTRCLYRIVGKSAKLIQTVELAKKVAPASAPVLINGESGTGKELISYLIHHESRRTHGPYIKVNCAALNDSLLESELFGHEKGAFTGACAQRKGRFEMAHGGTLLLDEITETPPKFQAKLLRVLEQQDFERVGGNQNVRVDTRIISTTNKDLLQEVQQGRFRRDLYYRLSVIRLVISPLRERKEDLSDLIWYFVNLYAREAQRHITRLDSVMMSIFAEYDWPGNVRQLRNVVRTSLILGAGPILSLADVSWLFDELQPRPQQKPSDPVTPGQSPDSRQCVQTRNCMFGSQPNGLQMSGLGGVPLEQVEQQAILDTLRQTAGNQAKAAKALGISDRTLRDKVRRYRQQGALQLAR
jgi:two-component system response regulator AtoC